MNTKEHLTIEGLRKIINIRASMNWGLSDLQKSEFSNFSPVDRPINNTTNIPDPQWIAGFVTGEGCFDVSIQKSKTKIGYCVRLRFRIYQNERDIKLIELIKKYLGAGKIEKNNKTKMLILTITKISDLTQLIIPLFKKYPIVGVKQLDFQDWSEVAKLKIEGKHLTNDGLNLIRKFKAQMNKGRKFD
jgi:hypothetical protein